MNTLFVFMGYPGSGKSYLASQIVNQEKGLYLSSDLLREEMFGFRDQNHNKELFDELYRRVEIGLKDQDVYLDATNLSRKDRLKVVGRFKKKCRLHLICVLRSITELLEVNETRTGEEHIPDHIFIKILGRFQFPTYDEGWDDIKFYFVTTKFSPVDSFVDYKLLSDIDHDNPHHSETIKEHLDYLTQYCKENAENSILAHIASYHDIGKFYVKQYNQEKGYSQFIGHAAVSTYIYFMNRLIEFMYDNHIIYGYIPNIEMLFSSSNFIVEMLGIYYHDYPYSLPEFDDLLKSLKKPSKPVLYLLNKYSKNYNIDDFIKLLIEFNKIDRMRE